MEKEHCTICNQETGNAGIYEDSLYPVLAGDYFHTKKGDTLGPLCEECFDALNRVELINHEG